MGLSSFNDSVTHMQGFVVYVNEGLPFLWDICLKKYLFQLALRHPVPYFFSSVDHLFCLYALFLVLFFLTGFSQSTHRLMCLSSDTLTSIIRTE